MELNNDQFIQYREAWIIRHRAWIPDKNNFNAVHKYGRWITFFVLSVFLAAGSISAVHTIPTVYNTIPDTDFIPKIVRIIVSLSAFIAIEGSLFLSAYIMDSMPWMAWTVLGVGFGIAIVANTFSIIGILGKDKVDIGVVIVGGALGFGAPLIALLMGKMYVDIIKTTKTEDDQAVQEYTQACKDMDNQILSDYTKAVQKHESKVSKSIPNGNGNTGDSIPNGNSNGKRKSNAGSIVAQYLEEHPDHLGMGVSELVVHLGIGKSTVYNMLKDYKGEIP